MDFFGVRASEKATVVSAPITAQTAAMAFGTAPVNQTGTPANKIVLANSYEEAVAAMGWSDDWTNYTLCEVIYSHFRLYGVGPLLMVNVLDPTIAENQSETVTAAKAITNGQVQLPGTVIPSTLVVKNGDTPLVKGTDYDVFFEDGTCIVEAIDGGAITAAVTSLNVQYKNVAFTLDSLTNAIIGGYSTATGVSTGLELADRAYFETKVLPDILIAPHFSMSSSVAAAMVAKAKALSVVFRSFALCDISSATAASYTAAVTAKNASGSFTATKERMCWPMLTLDGKTYHLSTQIAGLMCRTAALNGGVPSEPASNKTLQADGAALADGTEVTLDLLQANYLRANGITTALNFVNGFTAWGEYSACAPGNSDPKDMYCNVARMVNYICNTVVLTFWSYIDRTMTPRLASAICDQVTIWLNGLRSAGHLLGGRCELLSEENPTSDLMAGIIRPHIFIGVPGPAQQIDFVVEYDVDYLSTITA